MFFKTAKQKPINPNVVSIDGVLLMYKAFIIP